MKRFLVLINMLLVCGKLSAQQVELSVIANGGLFHYTGVSASRQSFINVGYGTAPYTNDVYGNKNAFSYGGAAQLKLISKAGIIAGLQTGVDVLQSKVNIVRISSPSPFLAIYPAIYLDPYADAKGHTLFRSTFINFNPFIGYRLIDKTYTLDIMPGIDFALGLSSREKGKAKSLANETEIKTDVDRGKPKTDFRLRIGAEAGYKKWNLSASYAAGKSNYMRNYVGGKPEAYSSYLRFGVGYRIF